MNKSFLFEYHLSDLFDYSRNLADVLGTAVVNNQINYPAHIAAGTSKFFTINEFISFQVTHYKATERLVFKRTPDNSNHIVITFQDFSFTRCKEHDFECNEIILTNNHIGSIQCKNTRTPEIIVVEPGLEVRIVMILLKENWVNNIFQDPHAREKFNKYLDAQNANLRKEYLSVDQRKLFQEIVSRQTSSLLEHLYYESRVLNLLESFLSDIVAKQEDKDKENYIFCSDEDIRMMQLAEKFITENVMEPFAGVEKLSRLCCMSRTKFINLFQKVYGQSSFEYYQKKRLRIAYDLLKSGKYSVSAAANKLGYTHITNFTQAFKRDFGFLPSDLLDEVRN